jgi:hypothetical protein
LSRAFISQNKAQSTKKITLSKNYDQNWTLSLHEVPPQKGTHATPHVIET